MMCRVSIHRSSRPVPPWKKILNVPSNKQALVAFLCKYMETNTPKLLSTHPGRKLFLAGGFENGEEAKSIVTRTTDLWSFIPVHDICHSQSPLFLKVLPSIHTLTGCDSTCFFFGIGKNSVYNKVDILHLVSKKRKTSS